MNAPETNMPLAAAPAVDNALPLYRIALLPLVDPSSTGREAEWLRAADGRASAAALFEDWQRAPPDPDTRLHALCGAHWAFNRRSRAPGAFRHDLLQPMPNTRKGRLGCRVANMRGAM